MLVLVTVASWHSDVDGLLYIIVPPIYESRPDSSTAGDSEISLLLRKQWWLISQ